MLAPYGGALWSEGGAQAPGAPPLDTPLPYMPRAQTPPTIRTGEGLVTFVDFLGCAESACSGFQSEHERCAAVRKSCDFLINVDRLAVLHHKL